MRRLLTIVLLLLLPARQAAAQWDTAGLRMDHFATTPALVSAGLGAAGSVLTFVPAANRLAVAVRDEVVAADLPRLHFDDYLQYLPLSTPVVLQLCGVKGRHSLGRMAMLEGGSYLLGGGWLYGLKYGIGRMRPDSSKNNSFPSGHTFTAFAGAALLRREYGDEYPWVAVAGYTVATVVALMRVYNNRHWVGDVLAGAGLGVLSVTLVYWALD